MLLRSSSTPLLGSLLPSFSESPSNSSNHHHHHQNELHGSSQKHTPNSIHSSKLSCSSGSGHQTLPKPFFHSPSVAEIISPKQNSNNGFRRVQSEGNLEGLADFADEFTFSKNSAKKANLRTLEAIHSFENDHFSDFDAEEIEKQEDRELVFEDNWNPLRVENMVMEKVRSDVNDHGGLKLEGEGKMYLATGLGVGVLGIGFLDSGGNGGSSHGGGGGSGGGGGDYRDGGDSRDLGMEEHYKKMLEANPGNPLVLRNYAQFLYQKKGDLVGAEEYYSRAILADPEDGDILSQYGQLIWDLHHDKERAAMYFERAVQASSEDSHVHAAYASFLWDTEDEEENDNAAEKSRVGQPLFHHGILASATA